jgi:hypothetical protein
VVGLEEGLALGRLEGRWASAPFAVPIRAAQDVRAEGSASRTHDVESLAGVRHLERLGHRLLAELNLPIT